MIEECTLTVYLGRGKVLTGGELEVRAHISHHPLVDREAFRVGKYTDRNGWRPFPVLRRRVSLREKHQYIPFPLGIALRARRELVAVRVEDLVAFLGGLLQKVGILNGRTLTVELAYEVT